MNNEIIELFNDYYESRMKNVIIGCIGRIESHDAVTMRAVVKPLLKYTASGETEERDFALLPDVPVQMVFAGGYYVRPRYIRGDLVWVSFSTHSISRGLSSALDSTSGGLFPREGALVVGGIAPTGWSAPAEFSEDGLILGHKDGGAWMRMREDKIIIKGTIELDGDIVSTGKIEAEGEIAAMAASAPVNLSTHIHPTGVGPSGGPAPGT